MIEEGDERQTGLQKKKGRDRRGGGATEGGEQDARKSLRVLSRVTSVVTAPAGNHTWKKL